MIILTLIIKNRIIKFTKLFINYGFDVNFTYKSNFVYNNNNEIELFKAFRHTYIYDLEISYEIIKLFIENFVNLSFRNNNKETILLYILKLIYDSFINSNFNNNIDDMNDDYITFNNDNISDHDMKYLILIILIIINNIKFNTKINYLLLCDKDNNNVIDYLIKINNQKLITEFNIKVFNITEYINNKINKQIII